MSPHTTETVRLLAVSRDSALLRLLWSIADSNSWHLETAANGWDAMERVQSDAAPSLLFLDLPRSDADTLHLLPWLRRLRSSRPARDRTSRTSLSPNRSPPQGRGLPYFPIQNVEKIRLRISSAVVAPVMASMGRSAP